MNWIVDEPYIEITSTCNLYCLHCYNCSDISNKTYLSKDLLKECFDYFEKIKIKNISISGGEPLTHIDIIEILKLCKTYNFNVLLATNGTLLTDKVIAQISPYVERFQISLDGDRKVHDNLRGIGNYDKSIKGIMNLCKVGLAKKTRVRMTISKKNFECIKQLVLIGLEYGLDAIQFSTVRKQGRASSDFQNEYMLSDDMLYNIFLKVELLRKKHKSKLNISRLAIDGGSCSLTNEHAIIKPRIDSEGKIFACHGFSHDIHSLGNIKDGLENIFDKKKINDYLSLLRLSKKSSFECKRCIWNKTVCQGGCPAQAYYFSGDIRGIDELCNVRNKIWLGYIGIR